MKDFPPVPKWQPNIPVDIEKTVQTSAYYLNYQRPFVVFSNGTGVVVGINSVDMELDAKTTLNKVFYFHADFNPMEMDDDNWLVKYSHPAFSIVFKTEIDENFQYIEAHHLDGLVTSEAILNENKQVNLFDKRGKIGLFGRARMFMDAQAPIVARIWKP